MLGRFSNALRTERAESESSSFRKQSYFPVMLNLEIIETEPLKILKTIKNILTIVNKIFFHFSKVCFCKEVLLFSRRFCYMELFLYPDYYNMTCFSAQQFSTIFFWSLKFFWLVSVLPFKKLFLNLDRFIIALWSSLVIKDASLARTYYF